MAAVKPVKQGEGRIEGLKGFIGVHEKEGIALALVRVIQQPEVLPGQEAAAFGRVSCDAQQAEADLLLQAEFEVIKIDLAVDRPGNTLIERGIERGPFRSQDDLFLRLTDIALPLAYSLRLYKDQRG